MFFFFLFLLLRVLTALHMFPSLYVIDMWQLLAVFPCLHPHGGNFFTFTSLRSFFLSFFLFYLFLNFLGALWCLRGASNSKPKAAGLEHCCSHTEYPFEIANLSDLFYLQDVVSAPPSSQIPDRNAADVPARNLPLQLGSCSPDSWSACNLSRKQWEAGHEDLPMQSQGCHSKLALVWNRASLAKATKAYTSNPHHNYLNFPRMIPSRWS